jgi:hypothetical protein
VNGQQYQIVNTSTGTLTIQTGGAAAITTVPAGTSYVFTCINNASDVAASWNYTLPAVGTTGTSLTLTGLTANSFLYSGTGGLLTTTAAPTNGQLLIGSTGAAPVAAALTQGSGITITNGAGSITVANAGVLSLNSPAGTGISISASTGAINISNVGVTSIAGTANQITASASTGGVTLSLPAAVTITTSLTVSGQTANSFLYSGTAGLLTTTAAPTNGQLLIGSTGAAPVAAALTAGTGISITNGAGSITVANTGVTSVSTGTTGLSVSASTGAVTLSGTLVVSNGGTGQTTFTAGAILLGNGTTALASLADVATGSVLTSGGVGANPTWTAFTSNATASTVMSRDANINTRINNLIPGYTTTATTGGITTLSVSSTFLQFFTGISLHTVRLPVTTTLVNGQQFQIVNNTTDPTAEITVQTGGAAAVITIPSNNSYIFTCINNASDVAASWSYTQPFGTTGTSLTLTSLSANSFLYSGTGGLLTTTTPPTNGQLLIGSTGVAPVRANLTQGSGITITNGAGSITVANAGVTSLSAGTTGLSVSASVGAVTLSGTLVVSNGGTGQTTFGVGSLLLGNGTTALASLADVATGSVLTSGGVGANPTWTAFTSNATASTVMSRDANGNTRIGNLIEGYTTTATAAGTTTLSVSSTFLQFFTGTTTQTVRLPVTTTLVNGQQYQIVNTSTGTLTIQTGGAAAITTVLANTSVLFTCINNASDVAASWNFTLPPVGTTGTSLTLTGLTANSFLYSGTGGLLTTTAAPTNGQLLVGVTGSAPTRVTMSGDVTLDQTGLANVIAVDLLPINATTGANSSIYFGYSSTVPTATTSIGIGYQAMNVATSATSKNVAIGVQALAALTLGQMGDGSNVAIGFQAMNLANADQTALSQGSTYNVAIGSYALNAPVLCTNNVMIGSSSATRTRLTDCVAVGRNALTHFTSLYSTGTASQSGTTITGVGTTFTPDMVGSYILYSGGQAATISGYTSATVLSATSSQTVGSSSFAIYAGSSETVALGRTALYICNSNRNVGVGASAGSNMTKATYTTGTAGTGGVSSTTVTGVGTDWTIVMIGGLIIFTGGAQGTISTVTSTTSLTVSAAITVANGTAYTIYLSNGGNTLLGAVTGSTLTTGFGNSIIGYGADCGAGAINSIAVGLNASTGVAAATDSIIIGTRAGNLTMTGSSNIGIGSRVLRAVTSGTQNLAIGDTALTAVAGGGQNIGLGHLAGTAITSGSSNTVVGANAGSSITTLSNNVCIGSGADSSVAGAVALGQGITANQTGGFFVTHRGPISATTNSAGFIAGTNELVELTSSRRFKTNIRDLEDVSEKFDKLRPVRFNPIEGHGDVESEHIGLIAEEVEELWPEFITHNTEGLTTGITYDRMISVLIKEIQTLKRRMEKYEQK